jgi:hypothetical protein
VFLFAVRRIGYGAAAVVAIWIGCGIVPFYYADANVRDMVLSAAKTSLPVLAFLVAKQARLSEHSFVNMCACGIILNFLVGSIQFFLLPTTVLSAGEGGEAVWTTVSLGIPFYANRVPGLLGNPNAFGAYVLALFFLVMASDRSRMKLLLAIPSVICIFVYAKSRNSAAAFIIMMLVSAFANDRKTHFAIGLALTILAVGVILIVDTQTILTYYFRTQSLVDHTNYRIVANLDGLRLWLDDFLVFGGGTGREKFLLQDSGAYFLYTESAYVKLLLERGIVGSLLHLLFFGYVARATKTPFARLSILYLALIIAQVSVFETVFYVKELYTVTFLCLGSLFSMRNVTTTAAEEASREPHRTVTARFPCANLGGERS